MIFSRAGFSALKFSYLVLLAGIGVAVFLVVGSYLYWQSEKKADQQGQRSLQDLRGRLNSAKRDRDDLRGSEDTFKALVGNGIFLPEQRFDLIEALAALKVRHKLFSLAYEVAPQRPLRLNTATSYSGVNLLASRVKLKIRTRHDADLVAFLDEFPRMQRGFFPLDQCTVKQGTPLPSSAPPPNPAADDETPVAPPARANATPATGAITDNNPAALLETECSLEWITLQAKGANAVVSTSAPNARPQ